MISLSFFFFKPRGGGGGGWGGGGGRLSVKPRENPNFLKNGKMVISVKI